MNKLDLFSYIVDVLNLSDDDEIIKLEILSYKIVGELIDYANFLKSFNPTIIRNSVYDSYSILDENINSISISSTYYLDSDFNNIFNLVYEIDINSSEILEETDDYLIFKCYSPTFNDSDLDNQIEFTLKLYKLIEVTK